MTMEERIKADTLWRTPSERRRFEEETSMRPLDDPAGEYAAEYHDVFVRWAISQSVS